MLRPISECTKDHVLQSVVRLLPTPTLCNGTYSPDTSMRSRNLSVVTDNLTCDSTASKNTSSTYASPLSPLTPLPASPVDEEGIKQVKRE